MIAVILPLPFCSLPECGLQVLFPNPIIHLHVLKSGFLDMISLLEHLEVYLSFHYTFDSHCSLADLPIQVWVKCSYLD